MKNYNFGQTWEIFVTMLAVLFLILLSIGGIITVSAEQKIENIQDSKENFEVIGRIPDTKWVKFSGKHGGELYICIAPAGEIYEVQKDSDGRTSSQTTSQKESFDYIYDSQSNHENICLEKIKRLPEEIQAGILRGIYSADISR